MKTTPHLILCFLLLVISEQKATGQHHTAQNMGFKQFWQVLFSENQERYLDYASSGYMQLCEQECLDPDNRHNKKTYATLGLLHRMMTSESATNCSRGGSLEIPYYWHWGNNMPRRPIIYTRTGKALSTVAPPAGFENYPSYADVDRTPDIFWKNLLAERPLFYTTECDSFYTFGWCSEREMAFLAMLYSTGFCNEQGSQSAPFGRVIQQGPHTWSELGLFMIGQDGLEKWFKVKIDNTFDIVKWSVVNRSSINILRNRRGYNKEERWYNRNYASAKITGSLRALHVSPVAQLRIRNQVEKY
jgi:hypothetical protein